MNGDTLTAGGQLFNRNLRSQQMNHGATALDDWFGRARYA
jgi:hypothetical protein